MVHRRLLQKKGEVEQDLRKLYNEHRPDLKLYAYGCESITADEFVEVYPLLPGQIDLILQITSALRTRSARAQGDDQAIRGLIALTGQPPEARKQAVLTAWAQLPATERFLYNKLLTGGFRMGVAQGLDQAQRAVGCEGD